MKVLALALAVVCFIIAVLYWTGNLQIGAARPGPHHTHAILFFALGILSLIWMRFAGTARAR